MARSFALRARGLRATSSSPGTSGRLVSTRSAAVALRQRPERVLHDAVLERVERDHRQPRSGEQPACRVARGTRRALPARGSPRCAAPGTSASPDRSADSRAAEPRAGRLRQLPGGRDRRARARAARWPARSAASSRSSPYSKITLASSSSLDVAQQVGRRRRRALRSIRMSSGSSRRKLKPRPSASSCIDDTPRSASTPSTPSMPRSSSTLVELAVVGVHELDAIAERRQPLARDAERLADRDRGRARVDAPASSSARVCPPSPTVQSTNSPPRSGSSSASTSATMHRFVRGALMRSDAELRQRARVVVGERLALELARKRSWFHTSRWSYCPSTSTSPAMPADSRRRAWIEDAALRVDLRRPGRSSSRGRGT